MAGWLLSVTAVAPYVPRPRLGQGPDARYESHELTLNPHDTIFFYTDGLTEGENTEGTPWGQRRLVKALAAAIPPIATLTEDDSNMSVAIARKAATPAAMTFAER